MTQGSTPAGWYDDGHGAQRWWDGTQWTDHTQPGQPGQPAYGQQQPGQPAYGQQQPWQGGAYPAGPSGGGGKGKGKLFAIIGAVAAVAIIAVVLLVVLISNSGGGGPKGAAEDYLEAQADLDFEKVCELSSEDAQKDALESASAKDCAEVAEQSGEFLTDELRTYFEDVDIDIEIGDVSEDGDDKADVDYTVKSEYAGDDEEGFKEAFSTEELSETTTGTLKMVKEDGDWKVAEDD